MANNLNAAFLRCALGPVNAAGTSIQSGEVPNGLRELATENVHGSFKRGLEEAAANVGVELTDVEELLPMTEVNMATVRLDTAQKTATLAWTSYAGQHGALLEGAAEPPSRPVDGSAPDVAKLLEQISQKVAKDHQLSDPLHALSVELTGWVELVQRCGEVLENGEVLKSALRRRRFRRVIAVSLVVVTIAALVPLALRIRAARARVDEVLGSSDPCAVSTIAPRDLESASSAQQQRVAAQRAACADLQRQAADARDVAARAGEQKSDDDRARRERETKCDALVAHIAAGGIQPEDAVVADGKGLVLLRVAKRALDVVDMTETTLPCADTPAGAKIAAAFTTALIASSSVWSNADDFSDRVAGLLVEHRAELPKKAKIGFLTHADELAKRAILKKTEAAITQAMRLCKLKEDLETRGGKFCPVLPKVKPSSKP
jgi:hypothetical protein